MLTIGIGKFSGEGGRYMGDRMMGYDGSNLYGIHLILCFITWVVVLALLIALTRWIWLKGDKEKKGK